MRLMANLRETKKAETRQRISDVATALFFERGFDAVTVDEVAAAAEVSKMTVFNYFVRKEDLLLDREDDLKLRPLRDALLRRSDDQSAVAMLRDLIPQLNAEKRPLCHVSSMTMRWWRVVDASPALKSRLRELRDEAAEELAMALGGDAVDGRARLAAAMIVVTVSTAREEAFRAVNGGASLRQANQKLLALMDQGLCAVAGLMADVASA